MASYIATGNNNFNTAATWHAVSANSLLDVETGTSEPAAGAYSNSASFIPGAVECDGIAVKLADAGAGAYTITCHLWDVDAGPAAEVAGTAVTINRGDLCSATAANNEGGWVFFEWASPVTLIAAHNYQVGLQESDAACNVLFYRNGTAFNWSRMLRTTTDAAAPVAAASILHIMERKTGAGAATTVTVTMNAIAGAILKYGSGTDASACLTISDGGTLNYGITAATAYYLQLDGNLIVYNQGTLTIGTVGSEIPRDGSAILEFDPTADGGMGLIVKNGGTFTAQGLSRTVGKNIISCKLNTDEAVNSTSLGVDTDTGWLDNDEIVVANTQRTISRSEAGTLNGAAAAAVLTVDGFAGAGGGLAYAHAGTAPRQADVALLTRNVQVRSSSSATMTFVYIQGTTAIINIDWVLFRYLGNTTAGQKGIEINTTTGSFSMMYSCIRDCEDWSLYFNASTYNCTFSYNAIYNTAGPAVYFAGLLTSGSTFSYNFIIKTAGIGMTVNNSTCAISYCSISDSTSYGFSILESSSAVLSVSNCEIYANAYEGIRMFFSSSGGWMKNKTFTSCNIWNNSSNTSSFGGLVISAGSNSNVAFTDLRFISCTFRGNGNATYSYNVYIKGGSYGMPSPRLLFDTCAIAGNSDYSTAYGMWLEYGHGMTINLESTTFGVGTAHGSGDIRIETTASLLTINANNCNFASGTELVNPTYFDSSQDVRGKNRYGLFSTKHDQTTGAALVHKSWFKYGTVLTDLAVFNTATPSMKMTPYAASYALESGSFKVNVQSGQLCTPTVYVRQSEAAEGDSADYNGSKPRLVVKRNDAVGITADAVIDTAVNAIGNPWEELTGNTAVASDNGVMEFVIQLDGTTGFVNVDDFTATVT